MSSLNGLGALTSAQTQLETTARQIAQGPATPNDMVNLLTAREQFGAGTKVIQPEDEMTQKLLDILG